MLKKRCNGRQLRSLSVKMKLSWSNYYYYYYYHHHHHHHHYHAMLSHPVKRLKGPEVTSDVEHSVESSAMHRCIDHRWQLKESEFKFQIFADECHLCGPQSGLMESDRVLTLPEIHHYKPAVIGSRHELCTSGCHYVTVLRHIKATDNGVVELWI